MSELSFKSILTLIFLFHFNRSFNFANFSLRFCVALSQGYDTVAVACAVTAPRQRWACQGNRRDKTFTQSFVTVTLAQTVTASRQRQAWSCQGAQLKWKSHATRHFSLLQKLALHLTQFSAQQSPALYSFHFPFVFRAMILTIKTR